MFVKMYNIEIFYKNKYRNFVKISKIITILFEIFDKNNKIHQNFL